MSFGKRKKQRVRMVVLGGAALISASILAAIAFDSALQHFYAPGELLAKVRSGEVTTQHSIQLGGLVTQDSVANKADGTVHFKVEDEAATISVQFQGILPDLFREGQGVIAIGHYQGDGIFIADEILAKHDEQYMPPKVAEALKESGEWREGGHNDFSDVDS